MATTAIIYLPSIRATSREKAFPDLMQMALKLQLVAEEQRQGVILDVHCNPAGHIHYINEDEDVRANKYTLLKETTTVENVNNEPRVISKTSPIADIFWVNVDKTLKNTATPSTTPAVQALLLLGIAIVYLFLGLIALLFRKPSTLGISKAKICLTFLHVLIVSLGAAIYFLMLLWVFIKEIVELFVKPDVWGQYVLLVYASMALVDKFTPASIRNKLQEFIEILLCLVSYYLDWGTLGRNATSGQVLRLLRHIQEPHPGGVENPYDRIYLVGLSVGSSVALDTLFPRESSPRIRFDREATRRVTRLVTFGCPFDLARTFLPRYYQTPRRFIGNETDFKWTNIYIKEDLLASNFRNDTIDDDATVGLNHFAMGNDGTYRPTRNERYDIGEPGVSCLARCCLPGVQAHSLYFGSEHDDTGAVCVIIAAALFQTDVEQDTVELSEYTV